MDSRDIKQLSEIGLPEILKMGEGLSIDEFVLKFSKIDNFPIALAADQIRYSAKIEKKFPLFKEKKLLITARSFEQSSSQATALYKKSRIAGDSIIDLTGGLGVDTFFLSKNFNHSIYCELDPFLCALFDYNSKKAGLDIESKLGNGIDILKEYPDNSFDWIFVDPSRRVDGRRVTALAHCEPNVTNLLNLFLRKSNNACIKAAPGYDISMAVNELSHLNEISVISYDGECREVLLFCSRVSTNNVTLRSVIIQDDGDVRHEFVTTVSESEDRNVPSNLKNYLYVCDPAIFKTGQFKGVADKFGLSFVNDSVGYLSGDNLINEFPGKTYRILGEILWGRKSVIKYLKKLNIKKASIARRDFPLDPNGIRKMLGIDDGGKDYLFFTKNYEGKKVCIHCIKNY